MSEKSNEVTKLLNRATHIVGSEGGRVLFAGVKGSVVYDLPGTHRDVDVRVVYAIPSQRVLALRKPRPVIERMEGRLDLVGWELEKFLGHLLTHNGNMVELLLTPARLCKFNSDTGQALREVGKRFLTKRLHAYYRGYAHGQFKRAQQQIRTGKGAIYTYREMYAGIWLMQTGELVFPWNDLRAKVEGAGLYRSTLINKFNMDREHITEDMLLRMRTEFHDLTDVLDKAHADSPLPENYDGYEVCNTLLLAERSRNWLPFDVPEREVP